MDSEKKKLVDQESEDSDSSSGPSVPLDPLVRIIELTECTSSDTPDSTSIGSNEDRSKVPPQANPQESEGVSRLAVPSAGTSAELNVGRPPGSASQQRIATEPKVQDRSPTESNTTGFFSTSSDDVGEAAPLLSGSTPSESHLPEPAGPSAATSMERNVARLQGSVSQQRLSTGSQVQDTSPTEDDRSDTLGFLSTASSDDMPEGISLLPRSTPSEPHSTELTGLSTVASPSEPAVEPSPSSSLQHFYTSHSGVLQPTEDSSSGASELPMDTNSANMAQRSSILPGPSNVARSQSPAVDRPSILDLRPVDPSPDRPVGPAIDRPVGPSPDRPADHPSIDGSERPPVTLHLSGKCRTLPSFQSDCLKACTWMRAMHQNWEINNYKLNLDSRYPRVTIGNRRPYENTHDLLDRLTNVLHLHTHDLDSILTPEQQRLAYCLGSMVEDYLGGEHREWYRTKRDELLRAYDINLQKSWRTWHLPRFALECMFERSASPKQSPELVLRASHSDVILSKLCGQLDDKRFFFFNDRVTTLDVRVFAVLEPILAISDEVPFELRDRIRRNYSELVTFAREMKNHIYLDEETWMSLCLQEGEELLDDSVQEARNLIQFCRSKGSFSCLTGSSERVSPEPDEVAMLQLGF